MRTPLPPRSTPARLGSRLLLALALCACGGGGKAPEKPEERAALSSAQPQGQEDNCTPHVFTDAQLTGSWDSLNARLQAAGASFPNITGNNAAATLPLCPGCAPVQLQFRSDTLAYCTDPAELTPTGSSVLMGVYIVGGGGFPAAGDTAAIQAGWDSIPAGDRIYLFANDTSGAATLLYNHGGNVKAAPAGSWQFYYCPNTTLAAAPQRPTRPATMWRARGRPPVPPGNAGDKRRGGGGGGTYGWLACASGCCQFYTPPPNEEERIIRTPPPANENAPDSVGYGRPYWCTSGNH